ncbi:uncharacterized protein LOC110191786 [Drosophila serrata]|uniref:uncharacterized protein LOC110191786 n=1 Tax=Drosophila serrata TaxID=7274 RepID=UPI000A1D1485|nr:uncharacterized protein LOC110191786 [Drosophila serrata]
MEGHSLIWTLLLALCCCCGNQVEVGASRLLSRMMPRVPQSWRCQNENIGGFSINLTDLSGYWYEVARVPNVDVLACLNVSVPAETKNDKLSLDLNYISTVNDDRQFNNESISFSWNNDTQHGRFNLDYDIATVTYKMVYVNYTSVALLCGFSSILPIPLFKLFSRVPEISQQARDVIQYVANTYNVSDQIAWEEQMPDRCNGSAPSQAPLAVLLGLIAMLWCLSFRKQTLS